MGFPTAFTQDLNSPRELQVSRNVRILQSSLTPLAWTFRLLRRRVFLFAVIPTLPAFVDISDRYQVNVVSDFFAREGEEMFEHDNDEEIKQ